MAESPYRQPPHHELVVRTGVPLGSYVWLAWLTVLVAAGVVFAVDNVSSLRTALIALLLTLTVSIVVWARRLRQRRWRFVLERSTLRVERIAPSTNEIIGSLDVSAGVRVAVVFPADANLLDAVVELTAGGQAFTLDPGDYAGRVARALVVFLRKNAVPVEEPPELGPPVPRRWFG